MVWQSKQHISLGSILSMPWSDMAHWSVRSAFGHGTDVYYLIGMYHHCRLLHISDWDMIPRTLSMTLGRPTSIPETHLRVDLPRNMSGILPAPVEPTDSWYDNISLDFYNSTMCVAAPICAADSFLIVYSARFI